jgi:GntR family transcriptional regulator, uxu operon transcriptional repressor
VPQAQAGNDDAQATASALLAHVEGAGFRPGNRIPTERALSETLGLSRHAVRQGLGLLERRGLISREVGRGTFLRAAGAPPDLGVPGVGPGGVLVATVPGQAGQPRRRNGRGRAIDFTDVGPADVMAARHILEPNAMPLVVARATSKDIEHMQTCLAAGDAADTYEEFEHWDLALHRTIVEASRNSLLLHLYQAIEDARHSPIWGDLKRHNSTEERRDAYRCDHRNIVDALAARDSSRASEAMQTHLSRIDAHLFGAAG